MSTGSAASDSASADGSAVTVRSHMTKWVSAGAPYSAWASTIEACRNVSPTIIGSWWRSSTGPKKGWAAGQCAVKRKRASEIRRHRVGKTSVPVVRWARSAVTVVWGAGSSYGAFSTAATVLFAGGASRPV